MKHFPVWKQYRRDAPCQHDVSVSQPAFLCCCVRHQFSFLWPSTLPWHSIERFSIVSRSHIAIELLCMSLAFEILFKNCATFQCLFLAQIVLDYLSFFFFPQTPFHWTINTPFLFVSLTTETETKNISIKGHHDFMSNSCSIIFIYICTVLYCK